MFFIKCFCFVNFLCSIHLTQFSFVVVTSIDVDAFDYYLFHDFCLLRFQFFDKKSFFDFANVVFFVFVFIISFHVFLFCVVFDKKIRFNIYFNFILLQLFFAYLLFLTFATIELRHCFVCFSIVFYFFTFTIFVFRFFIRIVFRCFSIFRCFVIYRKNIERRFRFFFRISRIMFCNFLFYTRRNDLSSIYFKYHKNKFNARARNNRNKFDVDKF